MLRKSAYCISSVPGATMYCKPNTKDSAKALTTPPRVLMESFGCELWLRGETMEWPAPTLLFQGEAAISSGMVSRNSATTMFSNCLKPNVLHFQMAFSSIYTLSNCTRILDKTIISDYISITSRYFPIQSQLCCFLNPPKRISHLHHLLQ